MPQLGKFGRADPYGDTRGGTTSEGDGINGAPSSRYEPSKGWSSWLEGDWPYRSTHKRIDLGAQLHTLVQFVPPPAGTCAYRAACLNHGPNIPRF